MNKGLHCAGCGKHMAVLRDAKVRNGMVVYCGMCDDKMRGMLKLPKSYIPDFMRGIFGHNA